MTLDTKNISAKQWQQVVSLLKAVCKEPGIADGQDEFKDILSKVRRAVRKHKAAGAQQRREAPKQCPSAQQEEAQNARLRHHCYLCKCKIKPPKPRIRTSFYCERCYAFNESKKTYDADLTGRYAVVTGGRIKLGFEVARQLLRRGANVTVLTRFPQDAADRYAQLEDFSTWRNRLTIYAIDLRFPQQVEAFCLWVQQQLPSLDILINNAAQTIKRPLEYYRSLLESEKLGRLKSETEMVRVHRQPHDCMSRPTSNHYVPSSLSAAKDFFPIGVHDDFGQQVDLRERTSWKQKLDEVETVDLLEVHLVNAIAPFILCSKLKPLFESSSFSMRFIVNVSALEGFFSKGQKQTSHPHNNMSKASLNMLTHTAADDYAKSNIYMCSVDPGWFSNELPYPRVVEMKKAGWIPPLTLDDAAARVLYPVLATLNQEPGTPYYNLILKDYSPLDW